MFLKHIVLLFCFHVFFLKDIGTHFNKHLNCEREVRFQFKPHLERKTMLGVTATIKFPKLFCFHFVRMVAGN